LFNYLGIKVEDMPNNCPGCGGGNIVLYDVEEIDRWIKPKQVTERTASGKTRTRYVNTTYVKEKNYYQCKDCFYKFTEIVTREK
jgi:Zn-finger nucleic acid-binding protein